MKYTYFILDAASQAVKIGQANNPTSRLLDCQVGNPNPLQLIGMIEGNVEKQLHAAFQNCRIGGEWFSWPEVRSALTRYNQIDMPPLVRSLYKTESVTIERQDYINPSRLGLQWRASEPKSWNSL